MKKIPIDLGAFKDNLQDCCGSLSDGTEVKVERHYESDMWLTVTDSDGEYGSVCLVSTVMKGTKKMSKQESKQGSLFFYQLEGRIANCWEPLPGHAYACRSGSFRAMFNLLNLTPGQRLRRVGDSLNFPEGDWKLSFLFTGSGKLKDWPVE